MTHHTAFTDSDFLEWMQRCLMGQRSLALFWNPVSVLLSGRISSKLTHNNISKTRCVNNDHHFFSVCQSALLMRSITITVEPDLMRTFKISMYIHTDKADELFSVKETWLHVILRDQYLFPTVDSLVSPKNIFLIFIWNYGYYPNKTDYGYCSDSPWSVFSLFYLR